MIRIKKRANPIFRAVNHESSFGRLIDQYSEVFQEGLGPFTGPRAKIHVETEAKPKFLKARPVPYAMTGKIEAELKRLQEEGTIEPVQFSEWAAPIVSILKPDSSIRIYGDYKTTVHQVSKLDSYPIPKVEDLFATLGGGEKLTKLDIIRPISNNFWMKSPSSTPPSTHTKHCSSTTVCLTEYGQHQEYFSGTLKICGTFLM